MQCACSKVRRDLATVEREIEMLEQAVRDGQRSALIELRLLEQLREKIEERLVALAA